MEENVQITMQWVYPSQADEFSVRAIKKKSMADRMKRGEHRNISADELVWEHAGARLGDVFLGKVQLVLGDESGSWKGDLYEDLEGTSLHLLH